MRLLHEEYVEEVAPGDEQGSATGLVDVFEAADLAVSDMSLVCSQREGSRTDFRCTAQMAVINVGPAGNVQAAVRLAASTPGGCTVDPASAAPAPVTLGTGQSTVVNRTWRFVCAAGKAGHWVPATGDAAVAPEDGYAEDPGAWEQCDPAAVAAQRCQAAPRSSAGQDHEVSELPFAVLQTATVSALSDVDAATLRFGVTGTESSVISCTGRTKDVDGDGRVDLVCTADPA